MLLNTFCHLPGIGTKTEENLWSTGVTSWDEFLAQCRPTKTHSAAKRSWPKYIAESRQHFENQNAQYFSSLLPSQQQWRLFKEFGDSCAYLDIETTGLGNYQDHVTTVAVYDGKQLKCYVHGINLDDFPLDVQKYQVLITFNGKTFDVPFLERQFGTSFEQAQIDLRYVLKSLGYGGGLKACEKKLGLERPGLQDIDGADAVTLWNKYKRKKDRKVLETLLAYNVEDTVNLQTLMVEAYNRKVRLTPFAETHCLPTPPRVENPYSADPNIVEDLRSTKSWTLSFPRK
ncbi:MAG: ribonuclease H-like domain-containing protein [Gemmataceae bacterium]